MTGFWPPQVEFEQRDVVTVMYVLEQISNAQKKARS